MIIWPAKDPDEVADYTWTVPLDSGDVISSYTVSLASGDVTIDSDSNTDTIVTVWLSGGTVISTFTLTAITAGGRTFEDTATISIISSANALLGEFLIRYPAFASVPSSTIAYWLTDAEATVTASWIAADINPARMALAAHNLSSQGYGASSGAVGNLAAMGVTDFKSASMAVSFDAETVRRSGEGGYGSTRYGADFMTYLRRNRGGPRLVTCA